MPTEWRSDSWGIKRKGRSHFSSFVLTACFIALGWAFFLLYDTNMRFLPFCSQTGQDSTVSVKGHARRLAVPSTVLLLMALLLAGTHGRNVLFPLHLPLSWEGFRKDEWLFHLSFPCVGRLAFRLSLSLHGESHRMRAIACVWRKNGHFHVPLVS